MVRRTRRECATQLAFRDPAVAETLPVEQQARGEEHAVFDGEALAFVRAEVGLGHCERELSGESVEYLLGVLAVGAVTLRQERDMHRRGRGLPGFGGHQDFTSPALSWDKRVETGTSMV